MERDSLLLDVERKQRSVVHREREVGRHRRDSRAWVRGVHGLGADRESVVAWNGDGVADDADADDLIEGQGVAQASGPDEPIVHGKRFDSSLHY